MNRQFGFQLGAEKTVFMHQPVVAQLQGLPIDLALDASPWQGREVLDLAGLADGAACQAGCNGLGYRMVRTCSQTGSQVFDPGFVALVP